MAQFGTLPPTQSQPPPQNRPPPPSRSTTTSYAPTTSPTPGQPLLNDGQLLVYPVGKEVCYKCHNTGYKPFNEYTSRGYRGDDPSHPCRKVKWTIFPYSSLLSLVVSLKSRLTLSISVLGGVKVLAKIRKTLQLDPPTLSLYISSTSSKLSKTSSTRLESL